MIKKIILISLFVIFTGVLVVGAANRTIAKSDSEPQPIAHASENGGERQYQNQKEPLGQENGQGGQGQGTRANAGERQYQNQHEPLAQGQPGQGGQAAGNAGQGYQGGRADSDDVTPRGQGNQGQGNAENSAAGQFGNGQGAGQQAQEKEQAREETSHELFTMTGTIVQAPATGIDMIITTADQEELTIGTGPGYLDEQGFVLAVGEDVTVTGFWEDDEFKVVTITRLSDNATIALRDEWGRPMWSGAVRNGNGGGRGQG